MDYLVGTIAAISTPHGMGGIGIIRISGADATAIADRVFSAKNRQPLSLAKGYTVRLGKIIIDNTEIDEGIALLFRAPHSYTGEDVVEFQCHGGSLVLEQVLRGLVDNGARLAEAGEFTRRAVLNGRISLSEAEGIGEIISAVSKQGEQVAFALATGTLLRETERLKTEILSLQALITANIDFPEEDVEPIDEAAMLENIYRLKHSLQTLIDSYDTGLVILAGVITAIVGAPNVGKSTLMNLMTGYEKSIVTPIAGTTRDVLEHQVRIGGTTLILADTAGIHIAESAIERIGVDRAYERIKQSSLVLAVFDYSRELSSDDRELIENLKGKTVIAIVNKVDLKRELQTDVINENFSNVIYISANDKESLRTIDEEIAKVCHLGGFFPDMPILVNERQRAAAVQAFEAISMAYEAVCDGMTVDAVYITLDSALAALMELSGENVSEAVLDEVFNKFCVGK